jgi:hypothetical protein
MKIILSVGILFLVFADILADQTITCKLTEEIYQQDCLFSGITIGQNEAVSIKTDPEDADVSTIGVVKFVGSTIHSVPSEIFTRFPKVKKFLAFDQNIHEIKADTFVNGKNLEEINLGNNYLTFLHADTFKGKNFNFIIFNC